MVKLDIDKPKRRPLSFLVFIQILLFTFTFGYYYALVVDDSGTLPTMFIGALTSFCLILYLCTKLIVQSIQWRLRDTYLFYKAFKENFPRVSIVIIIISPFLFHSINIPKPIFYGINQPSGWVNRGEPYDFNTALSIYTEFMPYLMAIIYIATYYILSNIFKRLAIKSTFDSIGTVNKGLQFSHVYRYYGDKFQEGNGIWKNQHKLFDMLTEHCTSNLIWPTDDFIPDMDNERP